MKTPVKTPPESSPLHQVPPGKITNVARCFREIILSLAKNVYTSFGFWTLHPSSTWPPKRDTEAKAMLGMYQPNIPGMSNLWAKNQVVASHISHLQVACDQVTNQFTNSHKIHVGWYIYLSIHLPVKKSTIHCG